MKILVANVSTAPKGDPFITEHLVPAYRENMAKVALPDTELVFRFPEWGVVGLQGNFYHSIQALAEPLLFHMCKDAEAEGFDAVLITCFADSFLEHLRQFINIPVVGIGESSYLLAAQLGKRFGVVTISEHNIFETHRKIEEYGLSHLCAGVIPTAEEPAEQPLAVIDSRRCIETFQDAARRLIAQGAEVIIPGCGLMTPAVRLARGCEAQYPGGVTQVDGAAVLDVLAAGVLDAEKLVRLKRAGSAWIARNGWYAMPDQAALASGQKCIPNPGITFWDI